MSSTDLLRKFVEGLTAAPATEWVHLLRLMKFKTLKKKEVLFSQGEDCREVGFVLKGLVCTTYVSARGKERIKNFAWEGRLVSAYASLLTGNASNFTATALEKTTLAVLKYDDLLRLYDRHPCWERLGRKAAESILVERERREFEQLMLDPLERYQSFMRNYAPIVDRIPQYLVASFLGITPVSLSRLIAKNDGRSYEMEEF